MALSGTLPIPSWNILALFYTLNKKPQLAEHYFSSGPLGVYMVAPINTNQS